MTDRDTTAARAGFPRRDELVAAWCLLSEGERDAVEEIAPDLYRILELLVSDTNREAGQR
ncbi:MAG TPA: hypothetical protein VG497_27985 [Kribbella sp.]|nr:hypothetical protein [Kribbella sp.]